MSPRSSYSKAPSFLEEFLKGRGRPSSTAELEPLAGPPSGAGPGSGGPGSGGPGSGGPGSGGPGSGGPGSGGPGSGGPGSGGPGLSEDRGRKGQGGIGKGGGVGGGKPEGKGGPPFTPPGPPPVKPPNGGGGEETLGNNLSFPVIFLEGMPTLRGTEGSYSFITPYTDIDPGNVVLPDTNYFAQKTENEWQAENELGAEGDVIIIDEVDIGDALESARLTPNRFVRLELSLYQDLVTLDPGEEDYAGADGGSGSMTAYSMTLLSGQGPSEVQGAQLPDTTTLPATGDGYAGLVTGTEPGEATLYESSKAAVYGAAVVETPTTLAEDEEGEAEVDPYIRLVIQKVEGLTPDGGEEQLTGMTWDGTNYLWTGDPVVSGNLAASYNFGPELNVGGKFIMGVSGTPFAFDSVGTYIITFAIEEGAPISFDGGTVTTPSDGRSSFFIADSNNHNGLLNMIVAVPSQAGGGEEVLA